MADMPEAVRLNRLKGVRGFMNLAGFIFLIGGSGLAMTEAFAQGAACCVAALVWFLAARLVTS